MINKENVVKKAENIINFPAQKNPSAQKSDNIVDLITMECFKKLNLQGNSDEIVKEYMCLRKKVAEQVGKTIDTHIITYKPKYDIENTVFDDYIICLEDGKKMQMLKRHLFANYGMTFQQYKEKWGLPIDYPYVCKNYSKVRQSIAKRRNMKKN